MAGSVHSAISDRDSSQLAGALISAQPVRVQFVYFDAGGGHRNAAMALRAVITEQYPNWQVDLVNLQTLLEPVDPVARMTKRRVSSEDVYNGLLKRGWTYGSLPMLRGLQAGIRMQAPRLEEVLDAYWQGTDVDLVVSLIPNFNAVLFRSLRRAHPSVPYVTIMTDLADRPPHFWQEPQDQFIICGSDRAVEQARAMNYPPERIMQVSGMVLKPSFYAPEPQDRRAERAKLGLDPDMPTALVMFGGNGSKAARLIVRKLAQVPFPVQSIVMCGHNQRLAAQLAGMDRCCVVGFTDQVPHYMRLADFFIGKPGPGSISEALHCGLPVIIERNSRTMPQETYNADWVATHRVGIVVKRFRDCPAAVTTLFEGRRLERFRIHARRLQNFALFEIPAKLKEILDFDA
ncbi:MAG: hypothetical protein B7Z67_01190 [Acidiphilium sp. 21-60-14]|nr:MAG: hypothetical protein B7Z67_01190 [Acidiphilium sp. 21-60-14]OYV91864.1 MAG: hypothetical protein B7Z57_03420 [Acidiphilium sp. 37-60-79]OZB41238.1 MAG: hypothetical protein B7X48_00865 [Acidiphilium sp. 34-60-192]